MGDVSDVTRLSMSREEEEHSAIARLVLVVADEVAGGSDWGSVGGTGFPACTDDGFFLGIMYLRYFSTGRKLVHEH